MSLKVQVKITGMLSLVPNKDPAKQSRLMFLGGTMFVKNPEGIEGGDYQEVIVSGNVWGDGSIKSDTLISATKDPAPMIEGDKIAKADLAKK